MFFDNSVHILSKLSSKAHASQSKAMQCWLCPFMLVQSPLMPQLKQ